MVKAIPHLPRMRDTPDTARGISQTLQNTIRRYCFCSRAHWLLCICRGTRGLGVVFEA